MLIYVSPRGDKKKERERERRRGERGGSEIRGLFRNDTAVASRRISPETTRTMRSEDDNGGAFTTRRRNNVFSESKVVSSSPPLLPQVAETARATCTFFFLFQTNVISSQRDVCITRNIHLNDSTTPSPCDSRSFSRSALSHFIAATKRAMIIPTEFPRRVPIIFHGSAEWRIYRVAKFEISRGSLKVKGEGGGGGRGGWRRGLARGTRMAKRRRDRGIIIPGTMCPGR